MPSVSPTPYNKDFGRNGDPRVNKALAIKLENPEVSLFDALQRGGFSYPHDGNTAVDSDGVSLSQRKNNLIRRVRHAKSNQEYRLSLLEKRCQESPPANKRLSGRESPEAAPIPCESGISTEEKHPSFYSSTELQAKSTSPIHLGPDGDDTLGMFATGIRSDTSGTRQDLLRSMKREIECFSEAPQTPSHQAQHQYNGGESQNENSDLSGLLGHYRKESKNGCVVGNRRLHLYSGAAKQDSQRYIGVSDQDLLLLGASTHAEDFIWEPTDLCSGNDEIEQELRNPRESSIETGFDPPQGDDFCYVSKESLSLISDGASDEESQEVGKTKKDERVGSKRLRSKEHVTLLESGCNHPASPAKQSRVEETASPWATTADPHQDTALKQEWRTTAHLNAQVSAKCDSNDESMDWKLKMALDLYRTEKRALDQQCMLFAGYSEAEVKEESASLNLAFALKVWMDEGELLRKIAK